MANLTSTLALSLLLGAGEPDTNESQKAGLKIKETASINGEDVTGKGVVPEGKKSMFDELFPELKCMTNPRSEGCIDDPWLLRVVQGEENKDVAGTMKKVIEEIANTVKEGGRWIIDPKREGLEGFVELSMENPSWVVTAYLPSDSSGGCIVNIMEAEQRTDNWSTGYGIEKVMANGALREKTSPQTKAMLVGNVGEGKKVDILRITKQTYSRGTIESVTLPLSTAIPEEIPLIASFKESVCKTLKDKAQKLQEEEKARLKKASQEEDDDFDDVLLKKIKVD